MASGSATAEAPHTASIMVAKVFTATKYNVNIVDVNIPANTATEVLTPPDTEPGPWTSTLTVPAKGSYRFAVSVAGHRMKPAQRAGKEAAMHLCGKQV